jgi:ribosomal protein S18 acetylase RimI-like enzyme
MQVCPFVVCSATVAHLGAIAQLHAHGIARGFLSSLGETFLTRLYDGMRQHPGTELLVCLHHETVVGFIAATESTRQLYKWILHHKPLTLGLTLVRRLFSIERIKRTFETLQYMAAQGVRELPEAELLSIAVSPDMRGLELGRKLIEEALERLRHRGVRRVRAACTEGLGSNILVRRLGFELVAVKDHHGGAMNIYALSIPRTPAMCPEGGNLQDLPRST